ncbi:MAG: GlsB/YeaQ/YmgE family stress response membrane protein [Chloroflexota bacterium]
MALLVILFILAIIALFGMFSIAGDVLGLVVTVVIAAIIGAIADAIIPGNRPYGFLGAALAGIFGSWLGSALFGSLGPILFGFPIVSALIGAIIVTLLYSFLTGRRSTV